MTVEEIVKVASNPDVTFSGGDPFFQAAEVKKSSKSCERFEKIYGCIQVIG